MKIQNDGGAGDAEALERIGSDSGEGRTFTCGELAEEWKGDRLQAYDAVVQMRLRRLTGRQARRQVKMLFAVVDYLLNTHIRGPGEDAGVCRRCGHEWPCSVVIDIGEQLSS